MNHRRLMKGIAGLTAAVWLMVPTGVALAQSNSTCQQYNPQTCSVAGTTTPGGAPSGPTAPGGGTPGGGTPGGGAPGGGTPSAPGTTPPGGTPSTPTTPGTTPSTPATPGTTPPPTKLSNPTLPFTGLDLVLILTGGVVLLAAGLVVRRVSRRLN